MRSGIALLFAFSVLATAINADAQAPTASGSGAGSAGGSPGVERLPGFAPPPEMNPTAPKTPPPLDPRLAAWSGIWVPVGPLPSANGSGVPFTPMWKQQLTNYRAQAHGKDDRSNWVMCVPQGPPLMMSGAFDMVAVPGALNIFTMAHGFESRHIFVDGRDHTPDDYLFDNYGGESVGKWGHSSLVVDTRGLFGSNEIVPGVPGSSMHVIERYHLLSKDLLKIDFTIEDNAALTKPWSYSRVYVRSNMSGLPEHYCVFAPRQEDPDALKVLGIQDPHS